MINIFKNFNILGLVAFIAAGIFAISWTAVKQPELAGKWYQVEVIDEDQPITDANLKIVGLFPSGSPEGDCNKTSGTLCAIEMDLVDEDDFPETVEQAQTDGLIISSLHRSPSSN